MTKRRMFDIDFPEGADEPPVVPAGTETRRGPMAAAITENATALRERQQAEALIRDENDRLAHELVRLKKLGLIVDLIPLDAIRTTKLTRDRASGRDPELDELKESIKAVGLSNPIRVEAGEGGFELVQGFRRLAAYAELHAETGDARYATIPAGLLAKGETLESLYRRMVDENLVRRDISFAEMAQLARAYLADPDTGVTDLDQAIATLYGSAGRQKRVYIRNFAALLDRIGGHLAHPHALPRALGLALLKRIDREPGAGSALQRLLAARPARSEDEELAILRDFADGAGGDAEAVEKPRGPANPAAKTSLRVTRGGDVARCTATDGRVELRMDRDFSSIDRHRLEEAVTAFLNALDDATGRPPGR
ncbi:ParB N-terminal domain-containing protein [Fertoebacter nigrum]|uniref:ParB N-terminal domain-containing protein n=1 Tax=Fertoeibacter niger TaxID=2656921 RepID=A0A8X8GWE4_9RHOB|nr:ParB N-terminal domain-containing protein [Fertoeibacter niger]NUB45558.1 ParB N-terminal domain-containing protein [Fertoeibacter niger]